MDNVDATVNAFVDWASPRYSPTTLSQYAASVRTLLSSGLGDADETTVYAHIRATYSISSWGMRVASFRAFQKFRGATTAAPVADEFQAWLQDQGVKAPTAYRYALAAATLRDRLTRGETLAAALEAFDHARPYVTAWARYVHWCETTGIEVPDAWQVPDKHGFPTTVLVAIRTLVGPPWNWPLPRLLTMTWDERITTSKAPHTFTWPFEKGGNLGKHLHPAVAGNSAYSAVRTIYEWGKPAVETAPFLPKEPQSLETVPASTLRAALRELEDLTALDQPTKRMGRPRKGSKTGAPAPKDVVPVVAVPMTSTGPQQVEGRTVRAPATPPPPPDTPVPGNAVFDEESDEPVLTGDLDEIAVVAEDGATLRLTSDVIPSSPPPPPSALFK